MEMNVSASMNYMLDNREALKNAAKNILNRGGASAEATQKIIEQTIFNNDAQLKSLYTNPQIDVLRASTQITLNNSLKETLKYLKSKSKEKVEKEHVLGELWNIFSANNEEAEKNPYKGELCDFEISSNVKNIFAA